MMILQDRYVGLDVDIILLILCYIHIDIILLI